MDRYIGRFLDNRYEILEIIGTGGMAVVYKAKCHRLNRLVAIKILKDEHLRDAEFRRRFHDEAQAVAMLSHPNIVSVYDVSSSGGIEYIVMELIEGITLKEYMKRKGALSWKETLFFTTQTAKALRHAHSRGIIHRDIKPHNIMLLRDGTIKVADFGIARLMQQQQMSQTQEAIGSVHYVAPEQAKGSFIDARADLYSLGVVMYEMLTGRLPFEGDSPVAVAMQHIRAIPLMPREIKPDIPEALESITMRAMNPSLPDRYASADEMLADLEKFRQNPDIVFPYVSAAGSGADYEEGEKTMKLDGSVSDAAAFSQARRDSRILSARDQKKNAGPGLRKEHIKEEDNQDKEKYERKIPSPMTIAFGLLILFFIGAACFAWRVLGIGLSGPESATVPSLIGKNLTEVLENKEYTDLFNIVETEQMYHDTLPDGAIIDQSIDAGRSSRKGATIEVTVSRGQKSVELVNLHNFEASLAEIALGRLDLLFREKHEMSDVVAKGYVIRTEPEAGTEMKKGDIVTLVISQGRTVEMVKVPMVEGKTEVEGRLALISEGLTVGEVVPVVHDGPEGIILSQAIPAGEEVEEKTSVNLTVSIPPIQEETEKPEKPNEGAGGNGENSGGGPSGGKSGGESAPEREQTDYSLKINLDRYKGSIRVTVKLNGVIAYDEMVNATEQKTLFVPLRGSGTGYAYVYVDGRSIAEQIVVFN